MTIQELMPACEQWYDYSDNSQHRANEHKYRAKYNSWEKVAFSGSGQDCSL